MGRASDTFITASSVSSIEPIIFVRVLNIPLRSDSTQTDNLYLTGYQQNVQWFDESGATVTYYSCGVKYSNIEVSMENPVSTGTLTIDNVKREFSSFAQNYDLTGVEVQVLRAFNGTLSSVDGAQTIVNGHIKKVVISETALSADIWNDFSLEQKIPRRLYSTNSFPYLPSAKDVRTVYTG